MENSPDDYYYQQQDNAESIDFKCSNSNRGCNSLFTDRCDNCLDCFCESCMTGETHPKGNCNGGIGQSKASSSSSASSNSSINFFSPLVSTSGKRSFSSLIGDTSIGNSSASVVRASPLVGNSLLPIPLKGTDNKAEFNRQKKINTLKLLEETKDKFLEYGMKEKKYDTTHKLEAKSGKKNSLSWIWDHFKIITLNLDDKKDKEITKWADENVSCNVCFERALKSSKKWFVCYSFAHSTGHLSRHLEIYHSDIIRARDIANAKNSEGGMMNHIVYKAPFQECYLKWIVAKYEALDTCEGVEFRDMIASVGKAPNLTVRHCTTKLYEQMATGKEIVKNVIVGEQGSETLDHWTSKNNISYVTQSFHHINSIWELKAITLTVEVHSGGSTGMTDENKLIFFKLSNY